MSIVVSPPFCGNLSWLLQDTNTLIQLVRKKSKGKTNSRPNELENSVAGCLEGSERMGSWVLTC